jgi:hypothetical protein
MKRILAATLLGALTFSSAYAADLELIPGRATHEGTYTKHVYTLKNQTNRRLEAVYVECGIFAGDELVDKATLSFLDIPPHGEAYDGVTTEDGVTELKCRILR